jgi:benzoyl-CoA reductase/2-hydroxyglutaryl-CoA dehydratase subunit BcrC/BadD/HgdB
MSSRTCTYVRHTLSLALEGHYDFLDGVVCLNTCDHVRRAHDIWRHKTEVGFCGFLSVPRNARESLYPYYREEVEALKRDLEEHFECIVSDDALEEAIRVHNRVRASLGKIEAYRAGPNPVLSGADMLAVAVAAQAMGPHEFLDRADALTEALMQAKPGSNKPRARLLLAGGELDDPEFVEAVESQGARVVADTLCIGTRAGQTLAEEGTSDPLGALCRRTFFQVSCARMIGNFPDRLAHVLGVVRERQVDGVVFQRLMFCGPSPAAETERARDSPADARP